MPKKKTDEGAEDSMEAALSDIRKIIGEDNVGTGECEDVEFLPTGLAGLDFVMGGGMPKGRIIEVSGAASSAKSSTCLYLAGVVQRAGGKVAWIDMESAWGAKFSEGLGVDTASISVITPECGEDAFKTIDRLSQANVDLVVIDSVSTMVPRKEVEGEYGQETMALMARMMSAGLRKLQGVLARSGTTAIFINQLRDSMNASPYGPKNVTTGGKALPFYSSVRLETARESTVKDEKGPDKTKAIGINVRIKNVKNKVGMPFRTETVALRYGTGFDLEDSLMRMAERLGIVKRSGSSYSFGEVKLGIGMEKSCEMLREDLLTRQALADAVLAEMNK